MAGPVIAFLTAAAFGAPPAAAQERPPFPPTRDIAVSYHTAVPTQAGLPRDVLVRYSVEADRLRVEANLPSYLLIDRRARRGTVVLEQLGIMADLPARSGLDQALILDTGKRFTRRGTETVAGLRCTVWDVVAESGTGTACVTADGVLLRARGKDRSGRTGSLEATRVDYSPQASAQFYPPTNLRKVDLPPDLLAAAAAAGAGSGSPGITGALGGAGVGAVLDRLRGRP